MRLNDLSRRTTLLRNIFPAAREAVEPWDEFPWHSASGEHADSYKLHASQALAIDVFGTLQLRPERDVVLDALALQLGLPAGGPWQVRLEWHDPDNPLNEHGVTRVDAMAQGARTLLFFECKFTENDGSSCSQPRPLKSGPPAPRSGGRRGLRQCDGSYMWQTNPANGVEARCALTGKGIRYWQVIPRVFDYDANQSYVVCPFAGPWFQWMRNLTACRAAAEARGLRPGVVLAYAPGLPMAARVRSPEWARLQDRLQPGVVFQALSFQDILHTARAAAPGQPVWDELLAWVQAKIDEVGALRRPPPDEII